MHMKPQFLTFEANDCPAVIGHYSHVAALPGGLVLISGQKAWKDASGALVEGGVAMQTKVAFYNIRAILRQMGRDLDSLVRVSCHLANVDDYPAFNEAYAAVLGDHKPVRTVLGGYRLRGGALVELVAEAYCVQQ
jgi:2-iminobutanoate/2-iminopropanoate deaminase